MGRMAGGIAGRMLVRKKVRGHTSRLVVLSGEGLIFG